MVFQANGLRDAFEGQGEAGARPAGQEWRGMTSGAFDPFDLPTGFDPLGREDGEPTGQSAYARPEPPPPRRPRAAPATMRGAGAGGRRAHLLAGPAAEAAAPPSPADPAGRIAALEAQVAALTARLDAIEARLRAPADGTAAGRDSHRGGHAHATGKRPPSRLRPAPVPR